MNKKGTYTLSLNQLKSQRYFTVLALGGELKASYCIIKKAMACLYYGFADLKSPLDFAEYRRSVYKSINELNPKPQIIACDLSPLFFSSRLAVELTQNLLKKSRLMPIQHHYAHIGCGMVYHKLKNRPVIGVACDGTGWGQDGRVWGFEFLVADLCRFQRVGYLNYFALPGSDAAIKEPWRTAISLLYKSFRARIYNLNIPWIKKKKYKVDIVLQMIEKGINSPLVSSAGRLFDGVAALVGICPEVNFEAQAAISLEQAARRVIAQEKSRYPFALVYKQGQIIINTDPLIRAIINDIKKGVTKEIISARFHYTFSDIIINTCIKIRNKFRINDVVLGGGVFLNKIIARAVNKGLIKKEFNTYSLPEFLSSDGGLALGQAVIAYVSRDSSKS